ncbi:hypothetical protein [Sphingomonas sp.]|nr:hypothetical protein [Sphingomonas sp.]MBO9712257.1 hypothetical protein [Sphingomonas sp.]
MTNTQEKSNAVVKLAVRSNWQRPQVRRVRAGEAEITSADVNADDIFS